MAQLNYLTDEQSLFGCATPENFALLESEGRGPLSSNIPEAAGFFRARPGVQAPDVEFHFAPSMFFDEGLTAPSDHGYCFGPVVIKPTSRGRVMLRSPLPDAKPRVLCNFLTTEEDRESMLAGLRLAVEIAAQAPLKAVERAPFSVPVSDSMPTCWRSPGVPASPSTTPRRHARWDRSSTTSCGSMALRD